MFIDWICILQGLLLSILQQDSEIRLAVRDIILHALRLHLSWCCWYFNLGNLVLRMRCILVLLINCYPRWSDFPNKNAGNMFYLRCGSLSQHFDDTWYGSRKVILIFSCYKRFSLLHLGTRSCSCDWHRLKLQAVYSYNNSIYIWSVFLNCVQVKPHSVFV